MFYVKYFEIVSSIWFDRLPDDIIGILSGLSVTAGSRTSVLLRICYRDFYWLIHIYGTDSSDRKVKSSGE